MRPTLHLVGCQNPPRAATPTPPPVCFRRGETAPCPPLHRALRAAETPCEQPPQASRASDTSYICLSPPAALLSSTRLTCRLAPHRRQHERTNDEMAPASTRATARAPTKWMPAGLAHDDKYVAHTTYPNSTTPNPTANPRSLALP